MNAPTGVAERLTGLVGALRAHGVRIGTGETVDAAQAVEALGLADRDRLREGLAATLLHSTGQRRVFDPVFDLYFPRLVGAPRSDGRESDAPAADREELRDRLAAALAAGDREMLERLAIEAVDGFGATAPRRGRTAGRPTRHSTGSARRR